MTMIDGLQSNYTQCITQDTDGFIWIGTDVGLHRYDGKHFIVYKHDSTNVNSLNSNNILSLRFTKNKELWVGTDKGLHLFNPITQQFTRFEHQANNLQSIGGTTIHTIYEDQNGNIWTSGRGLNLLNRKSNTFTRLNYEKNNLSKRIHQYNGTIAQDKNGTYWIGTWKDDIGIDTMSADKTKKGTLLSSYNPKTLAKFPNYATPQLVSKIYVDRRGDIWFACYVGLYKYNRNNQKFTWYQHDYSRTNSLPINNIKSICEDNEGMLWIATAGGGVAKYNPQTDQFTNYQHQVNNPTSLINDYVQDVFKDQEGRIWLATENGISYTENSKPMFAVLQGNLSKTPNYLIGSHFLYEDANGWLWTSAEKGMADYGASYGGLVRFHPLTQQTEQYLFDNAPTIDINLIRSFIPFNEQEYLVIVGNEGLFAFNLLTKKFRSNIFPEFKQVSTKEFSQLFRDKHQNIWIVNSKQLVRYHLPTKKVYEYPNIAPSGINNETYRLQFYEDKQYNILWIANTDESLYKYDYEKNKFKDYKIQNKYNKKSYVSSLKSYLNDLLLFSSQSGLFIFDKKKEKLVEQLTQQDGLIDEIIYSVIVDRQQKLWLVVKEGVIRCDLMSKKFEEFTAEHDLPTANLRANGFNIGVAYYNDQIDKAYVACANGLLTFRPSTVRQHHKVPNVYITNFKKMNETVQLDTAIHLRKSIRLNHDDKFIGFEFAILNYTNPERNQYAYKLEGFHKDWIHLRNKAEVMFTNLPPNHYILRVKASDDQGLWNSQEATLNIYVLPPWWENWWLRIGIFLSFIGIFYLFYLWRIRSIQKQKDALEKLVQDRTAEVQKQKEELTQQTQRLLKANLQMRHMNEELYNTLALVSTQKQKIEEQNQHIVASILYAQRIQEAILPSIDRIKALSKEFFILYQPRDIIGGDFYWFQEFYNDKDTIPQQFIFITADCTGHGVPGALMSMIGSEVLNQIINVHNITSPNTILEHLHDKIRKVLQQEISESHDGMDISVAYINKSTQELVIAAAMQTFVVVQQLPHIIKGDKKPIGGMHNVSHIAYQNHYFDISQPTTFYFFSDGYQDQLGGTHHKRFSSKHFHELLCKVQPLSMEQQQQALKDTFHQWLESTKEQIDDIMVIGIKL